jgi:hypothetical protein
MPACAAHPWGHLPGWLTATVAAALIAGTTWGAGQLVTSVLAEYDDEGYVMISLASYLEGRPLYRETYSQYGPAYYQLQSLVHRCAGIGVSHDATRFKTLAVWIASALLCAAIVRRLTGNGLLAAIAFLATACHLDKLSLEPGHPQEVCLLGTLGALLAATWLDAKRPRAQNAAAVLVGICVGLVLMTKINVGVLLALAVAATLGLHARQGVWQRRALVAGLVVLLTLPTMLCKQCWLQGYSLALPLLVIVSTAAVCWWAEQHAQQLPTLPLLAIVIVASGLVCIGSLSWCLAEGTRPAELVYGLVTQHLGFDASFYHSAPIFWPAVLLGLALPCFLSQARRSPHGIVRGASSVGLFVVVGLMVGFALATGEVAESGLQLRGLSTWLLSFGPLVAWACIPQVRSRAAVPLTLLAIVAGLMPLMAYPTPGTQVELGTLPLLLVMLVLLGQRWQTTGEQPGSIPKHPASELAERGWLTAARGAVLRYPACWLLAALILITVDRDVRWTLRRNNFPSLNLPGADWLRLPDVQVDQQRRLVAALDRQQVSTFVFAEHGQNRFYFWSQRRPPTGFNATFWPYMLTDPQQQAVIDRLERDPNAAVVALASGRALLPRHRSVPLRTYLEQHFAPAETVDGWQIWLRHPQFTKRSRRRG